ncbi:MAG: hypothetical protein ACJAZ2_001079 [Glaciecola sp.]|jgi:hypothetical protein
MKNTFFILLIAIGFHATAQKANKSFNESSEWGSNNKHSIKVNGNYLSIKTKVIYNALPDGYHITYTYSSISKTVESLEELTLDKKKRLTKQIKKLKMKEDDMVIDVIALDPVFNMYKDTLDTPIPVGFKSTHNVTFNIKDIGQIDDLSRVCITEKIYDIIDVTPYINNVNHIEDSLAKKSVAVLKDKKELAEEIGFAISDGKVNFQKDKNTIYPSERYLKSYIKNSSMYKHHMSQNSSVAYNRKVDIDSYYNFDLRDADFVFNSKEVKPVIQFIYSINYGFLKRDREEEARVKEEKETKESKKKEIYILDKNGKIRKASF